LLAGATHEFAHTVVIDLRSNFDPWALQAFKPELSALTVVRPPVADQAGEAAAILAKAGAGFILLIGEVPEPWLGPLEAGANRSGTVLVGVVDAPGRAFAHASSLSLGFSRTDCVWERGQLVGLRTHARCVKNRVAPPLGESELEIRYPLGAQLFFEHPLEERPLHLAELPGARRAQLQTECVSAVV
jgi:RecA/RadA recombinase